MPRTCAMPSQARRTPTFQSPTLERPVLQRRRLQRLDVRGAVAVRARVTPRSLPPAPVLHPLLHFLRFPCLLASRTPTGGTFYSAGVQISALERSKSKEQFVKKMVEVRVDHGEAPRGACFQVFGWIRVQSGVLGAPGSRLHRGWPVHTMDANSTHCSKLPGIFGLSGSV